MGLELNHVITSDVLDKPYFKIHNKNYIQKSINLGMSTESRQSNYYIGGSICIMTSMYRLIVD